MQFCSPDILEKRAAESCSAMITLASPKGQQVDPILSEAQLSFISSSDPKLLGRTNVCAYI
jgi:hypothetical protein